MNCPCPGLLATNSLNEMHVFTYPPVYPKNTPFPMPVRQMSDIVYLFWQLLGFKNKTRTDPVVSVGTERDKLLLNKSIRQMEARGPGQEHDSSRRVNVRETFLTAAFGRMASSQGSLVLAGKTGFPQTGKGSQRLLQL